MSQQQPPPRPLLARRIGPAFAVRVLDAKGDPYPAYFLHQSAAQAWGATNYPERFIVDRCDLATYDHDEQPAAVDAEDFAKRLVCLTDKDAAGERRLLFSTFNDAVGTHEHVQIPVAFFGPENLDDLRGLLARALRRALGEAPAAKGGKVSITWDLGDDSEAIHVRGKRSFGPVPCPSRRPDSHEQCRRPAGHRELHAVPGYEWTDEQAAAHDLAALERQRELGEAIEQGRRAMLDLLQGLVRDEMREGNHLFTQANTLKEQAEAAIERASVLRETLKKLGAK